MGPPNSGKTTLFNWITGYKRQTVNYPGSTVELAFGSVQKSLAPVVQWKVVDTPGVYQLFSHSPEEEVTKTLLWDSLKKEELRGVIVVLDATRLARQLPLVFYLQSAGIPLLVVLSMYDIQKTSGAFNIPLLSKLVNAPVCPIEGLLGGGVRELMKTACSYFQKKPPFRKIKLLDWSEANHGELLNKAQAIVQKISVSSPSSSATIGQKTRLLDKWLLHPVLGFGFLALILFVFFSGIFWLAQPMMNGIDMGFSWMADYILHLSWWGSKGKGIVDFFANGVLASFGAFFVFVPQVFILFLGICLLEDSGYLARAVSLVDGPLSRIGLSGKSLIPFLSGFACAIPATLATRGITSRREKWLTIFVIPLMACSARLPVYALLLSFLFYGDAAWKPGLFMSVLYFLSLFLAVVSAGILNLFADKKEKSLFLMELPLYRRPALFSVLSVAWSRTRHFVWKAGPVIFIFALVMWTATHFPRYPDLPPQEQVRQSYAGQFGQWIEPAFQQMGADWRVGISLLSAFVAREVFVSVLAVVLKNTEGEEDLGALVETMRHAQFSHSDRPLFSTASVMALLVFFMISLQCLSTTGIVYRETLSWKFALTQLVSLNIIGYAGAVLTYYLL